MTAVQWEHPDAVAEFDAAVRWYEAQEPGIGMRLIDGAEQARGDIMRWPHAAPPYTTADDGTVIRSKAVTGYPYRIVYTVESDAILILAYAHERREPGYWLRRLNDWR
ncbi:type II toxin-antitoxin system RelE/ParE family toxin [Micrococcales bacterium 31B]|nr:type II toxin-antitoxin system RelE/ParE family toxin [Micrococcales bacterium 31B]